MFTNMFPSFNRIMRFRILALLLSVAISAMVFADSQTQDLEKARSIINQRRGYEEAKAILEKVIAEDPKNAEALFLMGKILYVQHDYDAAERYSGEAVAINPKNANYHVLFGKAAGAGARHGGMLSKASHARKCKAEFEAAVAVDPKNLDARWALMDYYYEAPWIVGGSRKDAFAQAKEIGNINVSEGHTALGELYRMDKKTEEAEREYKLGIEANSQNINSYLRFIKFLLMQERVKEAEPYITKGVQLAPNNVTALYYVARMDVVEGQKLDEAERYLKMYLEHYPEETYPDWAIGHLRLGQMYEKQHKNDQAIKEFQETLKLMPDLKEAKEGLKRLSKS